ncbi:MAG TPA: hypothetical protein DCY35_00100 [Prolixibacteraceae bacterium]|nr:hypothetical protein [Prolixibacteraceae bacterium]
MKLTRIIFFVLIVISAGCISPAVQVKTNEGQGELAKRLTKVQDRLLHGDVPKFTTEFILADVSLDPAYQRRFTEFSGDISGRYLQALSMTQPEANPVDIHSLAEQVLKYQKPDGRFGDESLSFAPGDISDRHMALLWGNGRLLVGLMEYHKAYGKPEVLQSAVRLGEFLSGIAGTMLKPEVAEQFKESLAMGYICFTQLMEGWAMLYDATGDKSYLELAEKAGQYLPERGVQHSHGYLNTLLGSLMLYERTEDETHLSFARDRFDELVASTDYLVTGGVAEFFGEPREGHSYRDEGCSEADFLFVAFKLWEVTEDSKYLELAEKCLLNHFFFNQFETGDFGHHHIDRGVGFVASDNVGYAWWCCNFHGIRGLHETQGHCVTCKENACRVNLFLEGTFGGEEATVSINRTGQKEPGYMLEVTEAASGTSLHVRKPSWAESFQMLKNGSEMEVNTLADGYVDAGPVIKGDRFEIRMEYRLSLVTRSGELYDWENAPSGVQAALLYGPYLMSVDDISQRQFMAEPSSRNIVWLDEVPSPAPSESDFCPEAYLSASYFHDGMYGNHQTIFRPMAETSWQYPGNTRFWFQFDRKQ